MEDSQQLIESAAGDVNADGPIMNYLTSCFRPNGEEENNNPTVNITSDVYPMDREHVASAIIFNFENFDPHLEQEGITSREGTLQDVKRLRNTFDELKINIDDSRVFNDKTLDEVKTELTKFTQNTDLMQKSNAIIVVFLTHGEVGDKIVLRDTRCKLVEFVNMLASDRIPDLTGRPKIVLVQACRGESTDNGVKIDTQSSLDFWDNTCDATGYGSEETKYPNFADLLIGFSSHEGHYSFRSASNGSWYIQDLCSVLRSVDLRENDILRILTKTNRFVTARISNTRVEATHDKKQVSSVYTTLTKEFYLTKDIVAHKKRKLSERE